MDAAVRATEEGERRCRAHIGCSGFFSPPGIICFDVGSRFALSLSIFIYHTRTSFNPQKYVELAEDDQLRYNEEVKRYLPKSEGGTMKQKRKKDAGAPRHPKSAYLFFTSEQRQVVKAANPGKSFTEIGKILGELWAKVSPEERSRYEEMANQDKDRYRKEKKEWPGPELVYVTHTCLSAHWSL